MEMGQPFGVAYEEKMMYRDPEHRNQCRHRGKDPEFRRGTRYRSQCQLQQAIQVCILAILLQKYPRGVCFSAVSHAIQ